jgi:hypothetical protein
VDLASIERAEVERLAECPLPNGTIGRLRVGCRSTPNDALRLELDSKWPDLFSLNVAVSANPESFLEIGVVGIGGKWTDNGEIEFGGLVLLERLVDGLSNRLWSFLDCRKALKTDALLEESGSGSPKVVEFWLTYLAKELMGAFWVKVASFSEENAS